jgi:hypothetical protein
MDEANRRARNDSMLGELYPAFRVRVQALLKALENDGYRPRIQEAWRSVADQLADYQAKRSAVQYGFHNVTSADGTKESLAADIYDDDNPVSPNPDYILHLAAEAQSNDLISGVRWGLSDEDSALIDVALANKNWDAKVKIGWDPLHVQVTGMTIQEAKQGKRPAMPEGMAEDQAMKTPRYRVENLLTHQAVEYEWNTAFKPVVLLPVPYVSQLGTGADTHKNDCGATSSVMLLRAYLNIEMTPDEFYTKFAIKGDPYLSIQQIRNAMGSLGLMTDFRAGLALQDLFTFLAAGKPVIVLLRYKVLSEAGLTEKTFQGPHMAVVVGIDSKYIYIHDPLYTEPTDGDSHPYPLDIFWQAWKEVAMDSSFPNPERSAIIPVSGLGFQLVRKVQVNIPTLNVRTGPGLNNSVVSTVHKGDIVDVSRELNGWGEIGDKRWIYLVYTKPA